MIAKILLTGVLVSSARTDKVLKVIVANPTMIEAFKSGLRPAFPGWLQDREAAVDAEEEHGGFRRGRPRPSRSNPNLKLCRVNALTLSVRILDLRHGTRLRYYRLHYLAAIRSLAKLGWQNFLSWQNFDRTESLLPRHSSGIGLTWP
jgi:hypothetical protein